MLCRPTPTERREASALLAGCHERWRRQRPDSALLTRPDWHHLLPLIAQVQTQRPEVALTAVLTDRVASARSLPGVLAWRLWRLLRQSRPQETRPEEPAHPPVTHPRPTTDEKSEDWHQHRATVRAVGGPAAVRAALAAAGAHPNAQTGERANKNKLQQPTDDHYPVSNKAG